MKSDILGQLYKTYYKDLYLYIFSLCKDTHLAEDLVSDTFYKAMLSLEGNEKHMKYWLFKVAKHLWIDYLKKKPTLSIDQLNLLTTSDVPLEKLIKTEEKRIVYQGILSLSDKYKEILILYYYNGYSLKEISALLKIGGGAARTLLYRARIKLREVLNERF